MTITEKIEYARLRAAGASSFANDNAEAQRWLKALGELEKELEAQ